MKQKDKELLLKDLSSRLSYGVICDCLHDYRTKASAIDAEDLTVYYPYCDEWESIEHCKPYLRPMSSMTEEEKYEYDTLAMHTIVTSKGFVHLEAQELIDWLNAHHFDHKGLIGKGLAIEAPNDMYKT